MVDATTRRRPISRLVKIVIGCIVMQLLWLPIFIYLTEMNADQNMQYISTTQQQLHVPQSVHGVTQLASRRIPVNDVGRIEFEAVSIQDCKYDCFYFSIAPSSSSKLRISGNTLSAMARGLHQYYKYECGIDLVNWVNPSSSNAIGCFKKDLSLKALTVLKRCVKECPTCCQSKTRHRYYLNQVTWSYSMAWWGWDRWERELDWMSLRGINLCLAHVAQESIWLRVYNKYLQGQFRPEEFFTGVAYLAWHRMGNLQSIGNPIVKEWYEKQLKLQHLILQRMVDLGISPILPAFNLHIPKQIKTPNSIQSSVWFDFRDPKHSALWRLTDSDPLAHTLSKMFIEEQLSEYRELADLSVRHYSVDTFNEMSPGSTDVAAAFRAVAQPIFECDTSAVLVVQMWTFAHDTSNWTPERIRSFMSAIPANQGLYLDLHGELRPQWHRLRQVLHDEQLVWTLLHNFGGGQGIAGELTHVQKEINRALPHVRGIGLAMEGIEQNEVVYDTVLDLAWENQFDSLNMTQWMRHWVTARYHLRSDQDPAASSAFQAWNHVMTTAYQRPKSSIGWSTTKSILELRPSCSVERHGFQPNTFSYEPQTFRDCTRFLWHMVQARSSDESLPTMLYDLIDFARQWLSDHLLMRHRAYCQALLGQDTAAIVLDIGNEILNVIRYTNQLLEYHSAWNITLRGIDWDMVDKGQYQDLRALFTIWSSGTSVLHSYASRMSAEIVRGVYLPRWELWLDSTSKNSRADPNLMERRFEEIETNWIVDQSEYAMTTSSVKTRDDMDALEQLIDKIVAL